MFQNVIVRALAVCLLVGTTGCLATDESDPEVGEAEQAFSSQEVNPVAGDAPIAPWWEQVGTTAQPRIPGEFVDHALTEPAQLTAEEDILDRGKTSNGGTSDPDPTPWQLEPDPTPWQVDD